MFEATLPDFPTLASQKAASYSDKPIRVKAEYVPITKDTMNLEQELLEQYNLAKRLIHESEYDESIPLNQKAQAVNSCSSVLAALIKTQSDLHNLERIRKIEATLIQVLKAFPTLQEEFLHAYEAQLKE
jgi:hypothetical protein